MLGLDEISLKKGYKDFVTLITYRIYDKVQILGIVRGWEKAEIIQFLSNIPHCLRDTVQAVCCDLYEGYMNACKAVFKKKVPIVADRFHVRKSELVRLRKTLTEKEYSELKLAISTLREQKDYFTDEKNQLLKNYFWYRQK